MRTLLAVSTAVVLLLGLATPVGAVPPDREPAEIPPLEFPAGLVCGFDLAIEAPGHNRRLTTFYDRFGNPRATVITGHAPLLAVNTESGAELLIQGGGRITLGGDEDTFVLEGSGVIGLFFFPGDVTPLGVGEGGLFVVKGKVYQELDANTFIVTVLEIQGTFIDVCAALASD